MNSLPQEIIDEIIDDLPHSSLRSSSLVARRWRKRSQQRAFYMVSFVSESVVNKWHVDTQGDPGGISSYVQRARFYYIAEWKNPALFSRLLENFNSLTTLSIFGTQIPEEVPEHILHRGIGNRVTALHLQESPQPSFVVPMILAFPNLKNLSVDYLMTVPRGPPLSHPVLPQRRTLDSLQVLGCTRSRVAEALTDLHFVSRRLLLDVQTENIHGLLVLSSATIVELVLRDYPKRSSSHPIDLTPFPALTSLKIFVSGSTPSRHLINTLSFLSSVPVLASVVFECRWKFPLELDPSNSWGHLDRWLSQIAKNTTVKGGLVLTLAQWRRDRVPEGFLPSFREAGKINTDFFPLGTSPS